MPIFNVRFPERVIMQQNSEGEHCITSHSLCASSNIKRGIVIPVEATNKRDAWDKMHRNFPFEKIIVD